MWEGLRCWICVYYMFAKSKNHNIRQIFSFKGKIFSFFFFYFIHTNPFISQIEQKMNHTRTYFHIECSSAAHNCFSLSSSHWHFPLGIALLQKLTADCWSLPRADTVLYKCHLTQLQPQSLNLLSWDSSQYINLLRCVFQILHC